MPSIGFQRVLELLHHRLKITQRQRRTLSLRLESPIFTQRRKAGEPKKNGGNAGVSTTARKASPEPEAFYFIPSRQQEIAEASGPPEAEPNKARCYFESGWHDTPVRSSGHLEICTCARGLLLGQGHPTCRIPLFDLEP